MPLAVGSPPWITNPGTMRWNTVSSKKPSRDSETNEAAAWGEAFWSRPIVKSPQLVSSLTV